MLDSEEVPFLREELPYQDTIALHIYRGVRLLILTGLCIGFWQYTIEELALIEVALKSSEALKKAVKKHREVFVVLERALWKLEPHGGRESLTDKPNLFLPW